MQSVGELILYKNNQLIAVNKPAGVASQPDGSDEKSMLGLAEIYCKHPLQLIHRLDRPASGVLLFAKSKPAVAVMHKQFADRKVRKTYLALVQQLPDETEATLTHFLDFDNKKNKAFVTGTGQGKEASLSYKVLSSSDRYHLLQIDLHTGRQHQIRVQMADLGSPIRGDVKYGFRRGNKDRSIQLHALDLRFFHPVTGKEERVYAPVPDLPVWAPFKNVIPQ